MLTTIDTELSLSSRIPVRPCPNFVKNKDKFCILHKGQEKKLTYSRLLTMSYSSFAEGNFRDLLTAAEETSQENLEAELKLSRAALSRCVQILSKASMANKVEIELVALELIAKLQKTMSALANINNKIEITKAITYTQVERLLAGLTTVINKYIPAAEIANFINDMKALNWPRSPLTANTAMDTNDQKLLDLRNEALEEQKRTKTKTVLKREFWQSDPVTNELKDEHLKDSVLDKPNPTLGDFQ